MHGRVARSAREADRVLVEGDLLALAEPLAARHGLVLVEVGLAHRRGQTWVRVVVDKPGGVTVSDLEAFHREFEAVLGLEVPAWRDRLVEVSSPGADRRLQGERDFRVFAGRRVRLAARVPVDGRREWTGELLGLEEGGHVVLALADGSRVRVPLGDVAWARLWMG
jgi:ribosome maturation factor RimP